MLNKIDTIDIMKGISILLIVFFHIIGQLNLDLDKSIRMLSYQGVNAFFLLSGFTLFISLKNNKQSHKGSAFWIKWIRTKFFRLSILYYIVLLFTLFFYIINSNFFNSSNRIVDFLLHFSYLHIYFDQTYYSINPAFWFMGTIALFYVLVPLLYFTNRYLIVFIFFLLLFFYFNNIYISKSQITLSFLFFIFGIFSSYYYHELQKNKIGFTFIIVLVLFLINVILLKDMKMNAHLYLFLSFISVFIIYMISISISTLSNKHKAISKINTLFIYLGKISFPIYLIHWGLIKPVFTFTNNYYIGTILYGLIVIFLSIKLLKIETFIIKALTK